jgi:TRAP-type C4-dicarboxylate transport system permease small subunit
MEHVSLARKIVGVLVAIIVFKLIFLLAAFLVLGGTCGAALGFGGYSVLAVIAGIALLPLAFVSAVKTYRYFVKEPEAVERKPDVKTIVPDAPRSVVDPGPSQAAGSDDPNCY